MIVMPIKIVTPLDIYNHDYSSNNISAIAE